MPTSAAHAPSGTTAEQVPGAEELLGSASYDEVVRHFSAEPGAPSASVVQCWIPRYTAAFGPFGADVLPHRTIVRFLHHALGMSLEGISALGDDAQSPGGPTAPARDHT
jgi:hypothetical protein